MSVRPADTDWEQLLLYLHEYDYDNDERDPSAFYDDVVEKTEIYNSDDAEAAHEYLASRGLAKPKGTTEGVLTADGVHTASLLTSRKASYNTRQRLYYVAQAALVFLGVLIGMAGSIAVSVGGTPDVYVSLILIGAAFGATAVVVVRQLIQ